MTALPQSLSVSPNIPHNKQTLRQLRQEREHWETKIQNASGWGAAVGFADSQRKLCDRWIETRMAEGVLA